MQWFSASSYPVFYNDLYRERYKTVNSDSSYTEPLKILQTFSACRKKTIDE